MVSESSPLPALYVWSDEKNNTESPTKLPVVEIESISKSSKESSVSRSQKDATNCKTRDHNTCLCCGYVGAEGLGMEAAHVYEFGVHSKMAKAEGLAKLAELDLIEINEQRNMMTLCRKCHNHFDSHNITIHPVDLRWIVTDVLRGPEHFAPASVLYSCIHGKEVVFIKLVYKPPLEVLQERYHNFEANQIKKGATKDGNSKGGNSKGGNSNGHNSKGGETTAVAAKARTYYCHFCLETFSESFSLNDHVDLCRITKATQELSV
jgi:5-methylcytosine-specific restriction endonuclease McrA